MSYSVASMDALVHDGVRSLRRLDLDLLGSGPAPPGFRTGNRGSTPTDEVQVGSPGYCAPVVFGEDREAEIGADDREDQHDHWISSRVSTLRIRTFWRTPRHAASRPAVPSR